MMPPTERAAVLLTLMRELEGVMRAEEALLRDMRLERLRGLQGEKAALAEAYEAELRRLRGAPELVAALGDEARAALEEATRRFRAAAETNRRRLEAARRVVEGIVRALGDDMAKAHRPQHYRPVAAGRPGREAAGGGRVVPLAVNHRV